MKRIVLSSLALISNTVLADTYHYVGPTNPLTGYHLEATFKVTGSLTPNTDYINNPANLNLVSGSISVLDASGNNAGASTPIPVTNWISIHTNANNLPSQWIVGSNVDQVVITNGDPHTSNGPVWQAYTNNAPAGWAGYLVGVDYEQYSYFIEYPAGAYATADGCPAATPCNASTTAWDPLTSAYISVPTYSPFNYGLNPTAASAANWVLTKDAPVQPVPVQLSVVGSFPAGMVGQAYSGHVTVSNGTAPYTISVSGLPAGLTSSNGVISGVPVAAGTSAITISVTDSVGDTGTASASVVVAPAPQPVPVAVKVPNAGKSTITAVNGSSFTIAGGGVITTNASTSIEWNRSKHVYLVGDKVEWQGKTVNGVFVASVVTLN